MGIKKIYIGLPEHLRKKVFWVAREYRTNPLSHIPGGVDVVIEYHEEEVLGYDWIKKSSAYINTVLSYKYREITIIDSRNQLIFLKEKVKHIFARSYDEFTYSNEPFVKVWDCRTATKLPWEELERFDNNKPNERIEESEEIEKIKIPYGQGKRVNYLIAEVGGYKFILPDYYAVALSYWKNDNYLDFNKSLVELFEKPVPAKGDLIPIEEIEMDRFYSRYELLLNSLQYRELRILHKNKFINEVEIVHYKTVIFETYKGEIKKMVDHQHITSIRINNEVIFSSLEDPEILIYAKGIDLKSIK